jgi:hypothetical protein
MPPNTGNSLNSPFANTLMKTVVSKDAMAIQIDTLPSTSCNDPSSLLPKAILTATGARPSPITMMIGPITTVGNSL